MTAKTPWSGLRLARRLADDRRGATAVEFAIVAMPFLFMLFAILELAMVFMVNVSLDNATAVEGRKFRTGQECIDSASNTVAVNNLKTNICANMAWLGSQCMSNLYVDIRSFGSGFQGATVPAPITVDPKTNQSYLDTSKIQDTSGAAGSVNVLSSYYQWKLLTPFLYGGLQTFSGGIHLLISTEVLSFEPFGTPTASCAQG
jgi:Flp pilus assembly protein TadG